jgi:hypothetical protein
MAAFPLDFDAYSHTRLRCLGYRAPNDLLNNRLEGNTRELAARGHRPALYHTNGPTD